MNAGAGPLTFALPKGRVLRETAAFLEACGVPASAALSDSRRLVFEAGGYRFLVVRGQDVPTYVERGAADLGVAGRDVLLEQAPQVYEPLDLGLGYCRLVVAGPPGGRPARGRSRVRVATKYPRLAEEHFRRRGVQADVIKLYGSIELAPLVGLADAIVDLVSTGETLRQNGLVEYETVLESTCRLIVNRAAMKTRTAEVADLVRRFRSRLEVP